MRKIIFYTTEKGRCPVEEFLDTLGPKVTQKITWVLRLIEELPSVPRVYLKKLVNTDDIWEIRVSIKGASYRILVFWDGDDLIVLNYAFEKKTRKTPRRVIKIAEKRKRDYLKRRKNHA